MAEVCSVDEAFASVSGSGCGSGSGSPVNLWPESDSSVELEGHAVPLGTSNQPIDLCSDSSGESLADLCSLSNEDEGALPHWSALLYDGCVEAPADKPPFQLYCLLLMLPYDHAIHFEYKCCSCLGV